MDSFDNHITVKMAAKSVNEAFARMSAAAFAAPFDPTIAELTDIKTAVSEAVTNAIIHGYDGIDGDVTLTFRSAGREIMITVSDNGVGIADIAEAMTPLYTSKPELERSGMGFTVMEAFMDDISVESEKGAGTTVTLRKLLSEG